MPLVSVIMVFHRDTPYLRPAIASVLNQTVRDFEFVLVDNGTGFAPAVLGEPGRDPRIKWVRLPRNEGIVGGHNAGVAAATGEFIALLDYDDLAEPQRFERQVAALRADPGLALVSGLAHRIDETGRVTGKVFCIPDPAGHRPYAQYAAPVVMPAAMGRRELFTAVPYRPEFPFAADLDFQSRATECGRLAVLPEVLLQYRWYSDQTTQQKLALIENSRCAISVVTARRRAGRPENLAAVIAAGEGVAPADYSLQMAELCLAEGFFEVAAYRARRAFAWQRTAGTGRAALGLFLRIRRAAPAERRGAVTRMFFTGPVKALGLRPA